MIDLSEQQTTLNGEVGIDAASPATGRTVLVEPLIQRAGVNPERETTTRDESFVIVLPVADAVLRLFLCGHASRLADVSPPQLFMQQGRRRITSRWRGRRITVLVIARLVRIAVVCGRVMPSVLPLNLRWRIRYGNH